MWLGSHSHGTCQPDNFYSLDTDNPIPCKVASYGQTLGVNKYKNIIVNSFRITKYKLPVTSPQCHVKTHTLRIIYNYS